MHADVEEAHSQKNLVLLQRTHVELLSHRHDEVPVEIADVANDRLGVLEEEKLELVIMRRRCGIRYDLDDFEDVNLHSEVPSVLRARKKVANEPLRERPDPRLDKPSCLRR